jgi:hypothetical protein
LGKPKAVRAAQILFFVNAAIWLVLGVTTLVRLASGATDQSMTMWVVGILVFGNAGAMLLAGIGIGRPRKLFYLFALAVLVVNIILTFTDQVGIWDLLTLLVDLALLVLLIVARGWYFEKK